MCTYLLKIVIVFCQVFPAIAKWIAKPIYE